VHARILLWRWRLPLAFTLAATALAGLAHEVRPAPAGTVAITVSARPLTAGATLGRADLASIDVPEAAAPRSARLEPATLVGRTAAVDLPAGVPLVDGVLGGSLRGPAGTVVTVVRLQDARTAELLRAGDHVDVLAAYPQGGPGREVAHRSLVLPAPSAKKDAVCSLAGDGADGATIVLAVTADEALALSESSGSAGLVAVVVP
jgi:Flp pilus assembly protein CpaB